MKQIIAMMIGIMITLGAMAYPHYIGHAGAPHTVVVVRPYYGFGYRPYYSPYFGYNSLYSPYAYGYNRMPSKLELNIEQINNDYQQQIADVRHDKSLPGSERRSQIRSLKHERDNSIIDAKRNFYHPRVQSQNHTGDDVISEQ